LIDSPEHAAGWALFGDRRLALAVARGSGPAVALLGALARQAGIPASLHGTGGAWLVASRHADRARFAVATRNSLDRKVCNTMNVCCIVRDRAAELVPVLLESLTRAGEERGQPFKLHVAAASEALASADGVPAELFGREVTVRRAEGDVRERQAELLDEVDLGREWEWEETPELTLKVVDDVEHATLLFNRHSPQFIASLISEDAAEQERFYATVNAPFVGDGFTRWVDGQYALCRPELGLSNWQGGRLFGRGGVLSGDSVFTVRGRVTQTDPAVRR
jgi:glutamate-5-semialdehyde dehydrogenase